MQQTNPDSFFQSLNDWAQSEIDRNPNNERNIRQAVNKITLVRNNPQETSLHLVRLNLTSLPDCIGELRHLRSLNVCWNNLASIPHSIRNLPNLRSFNIGNNQLQTIPDSITDLTNLQYLSIDNNRLTTLPDLNTLASLTHLSVMNNSDLTNISIPSSLQNLQTDRTGMAIGFYTVDGIRIPRFHDEYLRRGTIMSLNAPPPLSTPLSTISQIHRDSRLADPLAPEMVEYFSDSNSLINKAFARFLTTTAYRSSQNKPALAQDLLQIYTNIYHKRDDADFCQIVSAFCEESLANCRDRNALFIFQLANLSQQKSQQEIQALSPSNQYDYFKSQFLFNHFYELGMERVKAIKASSPGFDEDVEVLLNYLRIFNNEFGGKDKLNLKFPRIVTQAYYERAEYQPSPEEIEKFGTAWQDPDQLNEIIAGQMVLKLDDALKNFLFSPSKLKQIQSSENEIMKDGNKKIEKLSKSKLDSQQYDQQSRQIMNGVNKRKLQILIYLIQPIMEKLYEMQRVADSQTLPAPARDLDTPAQTSSSPAEPSLPPAQPSPAPAQTLPAPAQPLPRAPSANADGQVVNQDPSQRSGQRLGAPSTNPTSPMGFFAGMASILGLDR